VRQAQAPGDGRLSWRWGKRHWGAVLVERWSLCCTKLAGGGVPWSCNRRRLAGQITIAFSYLLSSSSSALWPVGWLFWLQPSRVHRASHAAREHSMGRRYRDQPAGYYHCPDGPGPLTPSACLNVARARLGAEAAGAGTCTF
jgi:hypothetical protein